jgi:hypothetical protein
VVVASLFIGGQDGDLRIASPAEPTYTARFTMYMEQSTANTLGPAYVERANGEVDLSNELLLRRGRRSHPAGDEFPTEVRIVGDCQYLSNPDVLSVFQVSASGKTWLRLCVTPQSPVEFLPRRFDRARELLGVDAKNAEVQYVGSSSVGQETADHYRRSVPDDSPGYSDEQRVGKQAIYDYWINSQDHLVRYEIRSELDGTYARYEFYDFGVPVRVDPPPADDITEPPAPPVGPSEMPPAPPIAPSAPVSPVTPWSFEP